MFIGFLLLFSTGCESLFDSKAPVEAVAVGSLEGGWPEVIVMQPASFRAFSNGADSDGWSALFHGDLDLAANSLGGVPYRRVLAEQALFAQDVERLAQLTFELSYQSWDELGAIAPGSAVPMAAVLAALDRDDDDAVAAWIERVPEYPDPEFRSLSANLSPTGLRDAGAAEESAIADCIRAQLRARSLGSFEPLTSCGGPANTVLFEGGPDTGHGTLHNPLLYATHARVAEARQKAEGALEPSAASPPGLEYLLFSRNWNLEDFGAAVRGQPAPSLLEFGLSEIEGRMDDVDQARAWIDQLDVALGAWNEMLLNEATEQGRQVAFDVQPLAIYRSGVLQHQARTLLRRRRPQQAMVFLNAAMDLEQSREIGPRNRPSVFILRAEARLQSGRTREALDDLFIIAEAHPHLRGLQETLNDVAIMQSAGRSGDSKEH